MRRGIWITLIAVVLLVASAALLQSADTGAKKARYHQHLEQPSEAQLGAADDEASFHTHLPVIRIDTDGQRIPGYPIVGPDGRHRGYETTESGETEIVVRYETVTAAGAWHTEASPADGQGTARMRIRGNSSRYFSKSSYRLKLTADAAGTVAQKRAMLGMPEGEQWALYGPFLDKTLLRNYMWMNIAGEIMDEWVPNVRFCELFVNGEYRGLYVLMEMIDVQSGRLELTEYRDGDAVMSYLVRIEPEINAQRAVDNFGFYTYRMEDGRHVELLYPGATHQTQHVKDYVATDFNEVERMLYASDSKAWKQELDLDSFVDYYILEELLGVNDAFSASTYFSRDVRGKLRIGPVWDFNNVLDNFFQPLPEEGFLLAQRGWFGQMMQDETFVKRVIARYRQLRKGVLSDAYLEAYIDGTREWLGGAIERNYAVWGYAFDPDNLSNREYRTPEPGTEQSLAALNPSDYAEAIEWMCEYLSDRTAWMDRNIETLRQYCHPSRLAGQSYE